jgi:hypothetical protein
MFVNREAQVVWASLEFRKPVMLQIVEALAAEQFALGTTERMQFDRLATVTHRRGGR